MTTATITLPWPDKRLSPNARLHWAAKNKVTAAARELSAWLVLAVGGADRRALQSANGLRVVMTFHPPDARRRDLDNCIGATKAHRDGIADATGIDDAKWTTSYRMAEPVKGGRVVVTLEARG